MPKPSARTFPVDGPNHPSRRPSSATGDLPSINGSRSNPPATHPPRGDGGGYHGGLRDRRGTRSDGGGHYGGLRDRRADDADPAHACWSQWHCQSPAVVVTCSASIEAIIA